MKTQYILFDDVRRSLSLPGKEPITRAGLYGIINDPRVKIRTRKIKPKGGGYALSHFTARDARRIKSFYRETHWRHFLR